jgi:DNA-binding XRE family transcriptional regulator
MPGVVRLLILALGMACVFRVQADDIFQTRGLGARFVIVPFQNGDGTGCTYQVRIELTNQGVDSNTGVIWMPIQMAFLPDDLHLRVVDVQGNELPRSVRTEDQMIGPWRIAIPPKGRMDFPIGEGGGEPYRFSTGGPGKLLTFGLGNEWVIPQNGKTYYLCGSLQEDRQTAVQDRRTDNQRDWTGSVDLAKVALP